MELIPVFSLIVLVATIGTFILAVGAYVMFRLREARYKGAPVRTPETFDADVFAPQPLDAPPENASPGISRREFARDPRYVPFRHDQFNPDENPPSGERRHWR